MNESYNARPAVMLMQYRNERYEPVYAYIRVEGDRSALLKHAAEGLGFDSGAFGRTVASGRGEPSQELQAIIAARYDCFCRYAQQNMQRPAMV